MARGIIIAMVMVMALSWLRPEDGACQDIRPVRIAVLDTGIAETPLLKPLLEENLDMRSRRDDDMRLKSRHGTWVASSLALRTAAPIRIISIRIERRCTSDACEILVNDLGKAVDRAAAMDVDIIQVSSYGPVEGTALQAITKAAARGIQVVICAGNEPGTSPVLNIAATGGANVHVVGSIGSSGKISAFSANAGASGAMEWQLGENVPSQDWNGRPTKVTGTSFAASLYSAGLADGIWKTRMPPVIMTAAVEQPMKMTKAVYAFTSRAIPPMGTIGVAAPIRNR